MPEGPSTKARSTLLKPYSYNSLSKSARHLAVLALGQLRTLFSNHQGMKSSNFSQGPTEEAKQVKSSLVGLARLGEVRG